MPFRPMQIAAISALMLFGVTGFAAAKDLGPQPAAADLVSGFHSSVRLDETELGSVSGFGLGQQSVPNVTEQQDVSVILFDELGKAKGGGVSAGTGMASTVTNSVNVGGGR